MSNYTFFKRYKTNVYGVSGTLGTRNELDFLQRTFGLKTVVIPTFLPKQFLEEPGYVCSQKCEWMQRITSSVKEIALGKSGKGHRAVLIIEEDIRTAEEIHREMKRCGVENSHLFARNDVENDHVVEILKSGDVIVATNIAGRGTDLEINDNVIKAGGLFVLVTFLPTNCRVEQQIYGRCARKGQPGSGKYILNKSALQSEFQNISDIFNVEDLKCLRENIEEYRTRDAEKDLQNNVIGREHLFNIYCEYINSIKETDLKGFDRRIFRDAMHEYWGLWLEMNFTIGKDTLQSQSHKLLNDLTNAKNILFRKSTPCANICHIIKFANEKLHEERKVNEAMELYGKAINTDEKWAAIAFYNRTFCRLKISNGKDIDGAIADLVKANESFRRYREETLLSLTLIAVLPRDTNALSNTSTILSQMQIRCQILEYFNQNIEKALNQLKELKKKDKNAYALGS